MITWWREKIRPNLYVYLLMISGSIVVIAMMFQILYLLLAFFVFLLGVTFMPEDEMWGVSFERAEDGGEAFIRLVKKKFLNITIKTASTEQEVDALLTEGVNYVLIPKDSEVPGCDIYCRNQEFLTHAIRALPIQGREYLSDSESGYPIIYTPYREEIVIRYFRNYFGRKKQ